MSLPLQIFVLSAPSAEDLKNCALVAADWLEGPGATLPIADVAYSSAKTLPNKLNHPYRLAVLGDSSEDISFKLRNDHYVSGFLPNGTSPPQLCFLFAAFGSTYADMGNELYKAFSAYRDNLDEWMNLCGEVKDVSFSEAVLHDGVMKKNLVPMVMTGDSLRALWNSWGIYPNISLGHSVGEFMASLASGIYEIKQLADCCSELISQDDAMPIGRMIVVFANGPTIESLINRVGNGCLEVAVKNTENQFVLGGGLSETNDLVKICRQDGIPAFPLPVGRAFHTSMYKVKVKQFNADSINLSSHVKFISSITGEKLDKIYPDYWSDLMWKPVNFVQSSQTAIKIGAKVFLEIGGKPLLGPMLEENSQGSKDLTFLQSLKPDTSNMETMFTSLAKLFTLGYDVNWDGFYKDSKPQLVSLPNYDLQSKLITNGSNLSSDLTTFWKILDSIESSAEKQEIIQNFLESTIKTCINNHGLEILPNSDFIDIGIHTQQRVKLGVLVNQMLGNRCSVTSADLMQCITLNQLTVKVLETITAKEDPEILYEHLERY